MNGFDGPGRQRLWKGCGNEKRKAGRGLYPERGEKSAPMKFGAVFEGTTWTWEAGLRRTENRYFV